MALIATDWTVTRSTKVIAYIGNGHTGANPSYATVIEFHRWLQGLADDAVAIGDDQLDITNTDPSRRSTDNIITLINGYTIGQTEAEHLYDGSIIQGTSGSDIWDGIVNFGNAGVLIQIHQSGSVIANDWWNYSVGGTHTGAANASVLTDSALATALSNRGLTTNSLVGYTIYNVTDGSQGIITANTTTTITVGGGLFGGTENDFDVSDVYKVGIGVNNNTTSGISHRFPIKTRTASVDIDNRRLLGTNRRFGYTFGEFSINATARGNNVLALSDSIDLNNATNFDTVSGWTGITNTTEGYVLLDVNNDTTNEAYYSEWNKDTFTINQFYERTKYLTADGSTETLYGLNGELFRGITHQVAVSAQGATDFVPPELLSWGSGATAGTAQLLAVNDVNAATFIWIQLLTGVPPTGTITAAGGATVTAGTVTERPIAKPFVGQSTGSALIGAYGVGIETADLAATDKVTALDNVVYTPPNNVQNTVAGLVATEDRVLVAPWDGSSFDVNGDPAITKNQLSLNATLSTDNITSVVVSSAIPADTPPAGYIRVTDNNGFERRLHYSGWSGSTFTIDSTDGNEDFNTVNATAGNNVWIAYIDVLASATSASFTSVQSGSRNLVVLVRDGGVSPIKQFISAWSQTTSPQTITAIRTTDA